MRRPHPKARSLRKAMPLAERRLWVRLKDRQLGGLRFRRQHTIGPFVADFACLDAKLAVELDGDQHGRDDAPSRDAQRDARILRDGFLVLRFWNNEIATNMNGVLEMIYAAAMERLKARERGLL